MSSVSGRALVTGAGDDVGFVLAEELARRGFDLSVVAPGDEVDLVAAALAVYPVDVEPVAAELTDVQTAERVYRQVSGPSEPLDAAVLHVDAGRDGDAAIERVDSAVAIARRVIADMARSGGGRVLLTSKPAAPEAALALDSFAASIRGKPLGSDVEVQVGSGSAGEARRQLRALLSGGHSWAAESVSAAFTVTGRVLATAVTVFSGHSIEEAPGRPSPRSPQAVRQWFV